MAQDATICIKCGYDKRSGEQITTEVDDDAGAEGASVTRPRKRRVSARARGNMPATVLVPVAELCLLILGVVGLVIRNVMGSGLAGLTGLLVALPFVFFAKKLCERSRFVWNWAVTGSILSVVIGTAVIIGYVVLEGFSGNRALVLLLSALFVAWPGLTFVLLMTKSAMRYFGLVCPHCGRRMKVRGLVAQTAACKKCSFEW